MSKKKAPLTTVNFLLPVTGGHCGPNGKRACFFPVVFQSFESLSVVTDRQTDGRIKRVSTLPLFKVERIKSDMAIASAWLRKASANGGQ